MVFANQGTGDLIIHGLPRVTWPIQVGVVPALADTFQRRPEAIQLWEVGPDEPKAWIVTGLGGIGKSQLAAAHARRCWDELAVDLLLWANAATRSSIVDSYALALRSVTGADDPDPGRAADRFLAWLSTTDKEWMIVLDDVQSPADLKGLWPPVGRGRTVVTTRRRDEALTGSGRQWLPMGVFDPSESRDYLQRKVPALADHPDIADRLAAELGHLPLALAQVAAYMIDRKIDGVNYLTRLANRRRQLRDLLPEGQSLPDEHRTTVAATWSLSVEAADRLAPAGLARPVLLLASVLDPNGIPAGILAADATLSFLGSSRAVPATETLAAHAADAIDAGDAMDALHNLARLSLVSVDGTDHSVRIHALVQRATRESLTADELTAAYRAAADALTEAWPDVERDRALGQALRANADRLSRLAGDLLWDSSIPPVLSRAGVSKGESGLIADAIVHFRDVTSTAVRLLGPDHPAVLASRAAAARWSGEAGAPAAAARLFEELLEDQVRVLVPDHPDVLATWINLAYWRGQAGDLAGAITATEHSLEQHVRVLGPDHPSTLAARSNLAYWHGQAGAAAAAADEFEALLNDRQRLLGPEHPDTLNTRHNMARWRGQAGSFAEAVTAFEQLLADRLRIQGPDHPQTLNTIASLAYWQGEAGDPQRAATTFEELLVARTRILGSDHLDTLSTRHNIARWRGEFASPDEAVIRFEDLLADQIRVLGPDHPHTLSTRAAIAYWRGRAGAFDDAAARFDRLLIDRQRVLGHDHPDTQSSRESAAYWTAAAAGQRADAPRPRPPPTTSRHRSQVNGNECLCR
jgi:hypothetical protein